MRIIKFISNKRKELSTIFFLKDLRRLLFDTPLMIILFLIGKDRNNGTSSNTAPGGRLHHNPHDTVTVVACKSRRK